MSTPGSGARTSMNQSPRLRATCTRCVIPPRVDITRVTAERTAIGAAAGQARLAYIVDVPSTAHLHHERRYFLGTTEPGGSLAALRW
jgi:hypothetical protein